jgi:hypothetical protein
MAIVFKNYSDMHPLTRAMLAFNDYDYDDRENVISATSIMKPTHMVVLERSNKGADRLMDIEGMIPSVGGNALHNMLETALKKTNDETWKALGVPEPEKLIIQTEVREESEVGDHIVSGKYDVLFKYKDSKWQLADFKSMSVWGVMIDKPSKIEEWVKQMSIYRFLNQDKDIDDIAVILTWFTDWSKSDAVIKVKQGYPQKRTDVEMVQLWSIAKTKAYLLSQEAKIKAGMKQYADTGKTGFECSDKELWKRGGKWAYYAKPGAKRATKVVDTKDEAIKLQLKAKEPGAYYEYRQPEAVRCKFCSVTEFCSDYSKMILTGEVKV